VTRIGTLVALAAISLGALAGCGTSPPTHPRTAPDTALASSAIPVSAAPSVNDATLGAIYGQLYPPASHGRDCVGGTSAPSWSACPLTPRLVAALNAAVTAQSGPGAEPLCGCQAFDPNQTATYSVGVPPGGGTIHVTGFGAPHVAYVVVPSGGGFLVDDIIYCSPSPHSIYPNETAGAC
jgi:hypothetical protein